MMYLISATVVTLLAGVIFFIPKIFKRIYVKNSKKNYIKKGDLNAQQNYDAKFAPENIYSSSNKVDLSWNFLYSITDIILNKFTLEDRDSTSELGKILVENGAVYNHVIEYGLQLEQSQGRLSNSVKNSPSTLQF